VTYLRHVPFGEVAHVVLVALGQVVVSGNWRELDHEGRGLSGGERHAAAVDHFERTSLP
jgi:hypothetical protein